MCVCEMTLGDVAGKTSFFPGDSRLSKFRGTAGLSEFSIVSNETSQRVDVNPGPIGMRRSSDDSAFAAEEAGTLFAGSKNNRV